MASPGNRRRGEWSICGEQAVPSKAADGKDRLSLLRWGWGFWTQPSWKWDVAWDGGLEKRIAQTGGCRALSNHIFGAGADMFLAGGSRKSQMKAMVGRARMT